VAPFHECETGLAGVWEVWLLNSLLGEYEITDKVKKVGKLVVSRRGMYTRFSARCNECAAAAPFRLAVIKGGRIIPLGIMMPSESGYIFQKDYSGAELKNMGLSEFDECTIVPVSSTSEGKSDDRPHTRSKADCPPDRKITIEWSQAGDPSEFFAEKETADTFRRVAGCLTSADKDIRLLAVPLVPGKPFPGIHIFKFGSWQKINGFDYLVFKLKNGILVMR